MKILSSKVQRVEKWVQVSVVHKGKKINFSLITVDGKVKGEQKNNMATSYLTYFNTTSDKLMKKHFEQLKKYIENGAAKNNTTVYRGIS